ncbi:MAG TPA: MoaD/ThiS family protein [Chryseosolibacter sp.]
MATVMIPAPLRKYASNNALCKVEADNISDMIKEITQRYPDLHKHLIGVDGKIPSFINIYVDGTDIRNMKKEKTEISVGHTISIVPAIAGG